MLSVLSKLLFCLHAVLDVTPITLIYCNAFTSLNRNTFTPAYSFHYPIRQFWLQCINSCSYRLECVGGDLMWHSCWCQTGFLSISETADLHAQQSLDCAQNGVEKHTQKKTSSKQQFCVQKRFVNERSPRRMARLV